MELNELEKIRLEKIEQLRQKGIDPYPTRTEVSHSIAEALTLFTEFEKSKQENTPAPQVCCGRTDAFQAPDGQAGFQPHRGRQRTDATNAAGE